MRRKDVIRYKKAPPNERAFQYNMGEIDITLQQLVCLHLP